MYMAKISPSLACADFLNLGKELKALEKAGADYIHLDIMDGHFVPNFAIGTNVVKCLKKHTSIPFDVHLMIKNPKDYIGEFAKLGTRMLTFHVETCDRIHQMVDIIKGYGMKAGVALNPCTPLEVLSTVLAKLDIVLLMTVEPGFSGQHFIYEVLDKIKALRQMCESRGLDMDISVDGGISAETITLAAEAGANFFILGTSSIFKPSGDLLKLTKHFKEVCCKAVSMRNIV